MYSLSSDNNSQEENKMKTLQKIIAGAAIVGASMFGYNASAQVAPTKIAAETSIVSNKDMDGILMQRLETGNDAWTFKYDYHPKLGFDTKPVNAGMLSLNKLYDKKDFTIGIEGFQVGNFNGKDTWFVDAWGTKKYKDLSFMLDLGLGFPSDGYVQTYAIATFKHPKTTISGAFYKVDPEEMRYYGYAAYHDHNIYGVIGNKINTGFAMAGIYDLEHFGSLTFGTFDRKSGNIWIKSQTAVGEVNNGFYSVQTFDLASDILSMPMFLPVHLNPLSTKGDYALKLEYKRSADKKTHETEMMVSTDKIPFIQLGVGLNTEYSCGRSISDVAIEVFKEQAFKVAGKDMKYSIESRYNNRTHELTGYIKFSYAIGGK